MIVRQLLTSIGYVVNRRSEKTARESFAGVKAAAQTLGAALATGAIAQGFRKAISFASDAEETMNVVTTAFEDQAQSVLGWAKTQGEAAGRSEYAMREYAATIGALAGPTLGSADATADMSTNMAQLAVDLGSFFNATDQDALDALKAGLIGSSEPLQRFGVNMSEAALQTFATSKGMRTQVKDMNAAQKMTLRYQFILANTTKAQGDAAKTSDGFANQLKRLSGNIQNVATDIGKEFLGGAAGLLQMLNKIIAAMRGPLTLAAKATANALKFVQAVVIGLWETFKELSGPFQALLTAILIRVLMLHAPWVLWGVLIAAAVGGAIAILDDLWSALQGGDSVFVGLLDQFNFWLEETDSIFTAVSNIINDAIDFWVELFTGHANFTQDVSDAIVGTFMEMANSIQGAFDWLGEIVSTFGDWWYEFIGGIGDRVGLFVREVIVLFTSIGETVSEVFTKIYDTVVDIINRIVDFYVGAFKQIFGVFETLGGFAGKIFGALENLGGDAFAAIGLGPGPSNIAAPGSPAAGGDLNSQQTIEVNVNAPGGDGPSIAAAVGPAVGRAAADGTRRVAQQLLVGGAS